MRYVKHIQTVWKTEYCSPSADPVLSQPDSINIHKLVWPSLVEAALGFSSECTVCVYICVLLVAFVLGRHLSWALAVTYATIKLLLCSLETSRKTLVTQLRHLEEKRTENVVKEEEMCEAA